MSLTEPALSEAEWDNRIVPQIPFEKCKCSYCRIVIWKG